MFALPGIFTLIFVIYIRPQEVYPVLQRVPLLHLAMALMLLGLLIDIRRRISRLCKPPQLLPIAAFFILCVITYFLRSPDQVGFLINFLAIPMSVCLAIAVGVQTIRGFQTMAVIIICMAMFLTTVGIHQHFARHGCHYVDPRNAEAFVFDGRLCQDDDECEDLGGEPEQRYTCSPIGLLNTTWIVGRVRYRGIFQDPNDLALTISMNLPFVLAFFERKQTLWRGLLAVTAIVAVILCTIYTQSRGGQITFLAVMGIYFIGRFGWKGAVFGLLMALPVVLLGGREGAGADESKYERLEAWQAGLQMFKGWPILGVGVYHYLDYHVRTAHSAYILCLAETGALGTVAWGSMLYASAKIPVVILFDKSLSGEEAKIARVWAKGMLAAFAGMLTGIAFLSFTFHMALLMMVGMTSALRNAVQRHRPDWDVKFTLGDLRNLLIIQFIMYSALWIYVRKEVGPI